MGARTKWLAFGLMALFQLALPGWMIIGHERVLQQGEVFLFRTAPIDPRDPFRGEYVQLDFEAETGNWSMPGATAAYQENMAYGLLERDADGFARIGQLQGARPTEGAFIKVQFMTWGNDDVQRISLPFDRFYLEEGDGATTEKMLQPQWNKDTLVQPLPAHAVVRVLHGEAVIEDLVVGGKSIQVWLQEVPTVK